MLSLHSIIADIHLNRIHIYSSTTCHWTDKKKKEKKKEKKKKKIVHLKHLHIHAQNKCNHLGFSLKQILLITPSIGTCCHKKQMKRNLHFHHTHDNVPFLINKARQIDKS